MSVCPVGRADQNVSGCDKCTEVQSLNAVTLSSSQNFMSLYYRCESEFVSELSKACTVIDLF